MYARVGYRGTGRWLETEEGRYARGMGWAKAASSRKGLLLPEHHGERSV